MAPRKTKTTAAEPTPNAETSEALREAQSDALATTFNSVEELMAELNKDSELRFQVALAVFPTIVSMGIAEPLADENLAGSSARIAFEYADAFIAQSKKGECDAE